MTSHPPSSSPPFLNSGLPELTPPNRSTRPVLLASRCRSNAWLLLANGKLRTQREPDRMILWNVKILFEELALISFLKFCAMLLHPGLVLIFIYIHQFANVRWNGSFSGTFWMTNGVRQGAILSAIFYCIYMININMSIT